MANDTMTQEDRMSRDAQGELNDGLTDDDGNNVGVGIPSSGDDFGATPDTLARINPGADGATGQAYDNEGSLITDGGRPDEDYQDDDVTSGGNAAGSNGMVMGAGSAAGGTGLGTSRYSSSAVMDDKEFDAAMRSNGDDVSDTVTDVNPHDYQAGGAGMGSGAGPVGGGATGQTSAGDDATTGMGSSMGSSTGGPDYDATMGGSVSGAPGIGTGASTGSTGSGVGVSGSGSSTGMSSVNAGGEGTDVGTGSGSSASAGGMASGMSDTGDIGGSSYNSDRGGVQGNGTIDMGNGNSGTGGVGAGNAGTGANTMGGMDSAMGTGSDDMIGGDTGTVRGRSSLGGGGDVDEEDNSLATSATPGSRSDLGSNGGSSSAMRAAGAVPAAREDNDGLE